MEESLRHRAVRVSGPENVCPIMEDKPCVELDVYMQVVMRTPSQAHKRIRNDAGLAAKAREQLMQGLAQAAATGDGRATGGCGHRQYSRP